MASAGSGAGTAGSDSASVRVAGRMFVGLRPHPPRRPDSADDDTSPRGTETGASVSSAVGHERPLYDRFDATDVGTGDAVTVTGYTKAGGQAVSVPTLEGLARGPTPGPSVVRVRHVDRSGAFENVTPPNCRRSGATCVVTDRIPRVELYDVVRRVGALPEPLVRRYFRQLMDGVEYLHDQDVCHGDIRPENLGLTDSLDLQISSLAKCRKMVGGGTLHDSPAGQLGYRSPEVVAHRPGETGAVGGYLGAPADVWSCGIVLFVMVAGFPPMSCARDGDWWFGQVRAKDYVLFWKAHSQTGLTFSPAIKSLIERILVVDPEERATIDEIKSHPWYTTVDSEDAVEAFKVELSSAIASAGVARPASAAWSGMASRSGSAGRSGSASGRAPSPGFKREADS